MATFSTLSILSPKIKEIDTASPWEAIILKSEVEFALGNIK